MQNLLNVVMRRAGTDVNGKPLSPTVRVMLVDGTLHDLVLESAGPTAVMGRTDQGLEMIIPYTSVKYILP